MIPDDAKSKINEGMSRAIDRARHRDKKSGKPKLTGKQRTKMDNHVAMNIDAIDELTEGM